jgi:hypothetical protein
MNTATLKSRPAAAATTSDGCAVYELRQYTLHPGRRDELIDLFDREFVETQEAQGMRIVGQFRVHGAPDRFLWLRGFADMARRAQALQGFYGGPVWQQHRSAANATMIDASDVLLLRPLSVGDGFRPTDRPAPGSTALPPSRISASIALLREPCGPELVALFNQQLRPALQEAGTDVVAALCTEYAANNFPRLPVREGEHALVWLCRHASASLYEDVGLRLLHSRHWATQVLPALGKHLKAPLQTLLLEPTARSALR